MNKKRFDPKSITDEQLIDELQKLSKKLGRTPSKKDMFAGNDITKRLYIYSRRFGGLYAAQKIAGLAPNAYGVAIKYNNKDMLDEILALKNKLGKIPTQGDLIKYGKFPPGAYKRHFGTYNKALGLLNEKHNLKFNIPASDIMDDIIRVSKKLNKTPTTGDFKEHSSTVSWIIASYKIAGTNSWNDTLNKCGLKIINNRNIPEHDLKKEILRLEKKLKRVPGYVDMVIQGEHSPETYALRFGTYIKALKYFEFEYVPINHWFQRVFTKGNDGELYKSKIEAYAANALFDMVDSGKIIKYEYEKKVCAEKQWTCDFYILDETGYIWLEIDGMGKNRKMPYNNGNKKIEYYKENNYNYKIFEYKSGDIAQKIERILTNEV